MNALRSKPYMPSVVLCILGILVIPLVATLIGDRWLHRHDETTALSLPKCSAPTPDQEKWLNWHNEATTSTEFIICWPGDPIIRDLRGKPENIVGKAPANAELALYVNDQLWDIIQVDAQGRFTAPLIGLPERRNRLVALPTGVDSSTLPVFYLPEGVQGMAVVGPARKAEPPFLALFTERDNTLQVYGSTQPSSTVEICPESCADDRPVLRAVSDDEGSFGGKLSFQSVNTPTIQRLSGRVRYAGEKEVWRDFTWPFQAARVESQGAPGSPSLFERSISLTFSPTDVRLVFEVRMPTGYKVYQNLVTGDISELEFIEYIFGDVTLNTYLDPRKFAWRQEKVKDDQRVRVLIESDPLVYLIPDDTATVFQLSTMDIHTNAIPAYTPQDQIKIYLKNTRFLHSNVSPMKSKEDSLVWAGALAESGGRLSLWVSRSQQADSDPLQQFRLRDTLSNSMKKAFRKQVESPLTETLEGVIVGMLPGKDKVPSPVRAEMYDFYRDLYLLDPLANHQARTDTLHSFLKDLPERIIPDWIVPLLFGVLWLIPSVLVLWVVWTHKDERGLPYQDQKRLMLLGWGVAILVVLSLDWLPLLQRVGLSREGYLTWVVTAYLMFVLLFWLVQPGTTSSNSDDGFSTLILMIALSPVITWVTAVLFGTARCRPDTGELSMVITCKMAGLLPKLPDGWVSVLLTGLSLLSFARLIRLATRIDTSNAKFRSVTLLLLAVAIAWVLSRPIQALPLATQLRQSFGVLTGVLTDALPLLRPLLPVAVLLGIATTLRRRRGSPPSDCCGLISTAGIAEADENSKETSTKSAVKQSNNTEEGDHRRQGDNPVWMALSSLERGLGCVVFVAFVVGLRPSWSFIPVQLVVGYVLFQWIIPHQPKPVAPPKSLCEFVVLHRGDAIKEMLNAKRAQRSQRNMQGALRKLVKDGKIKEYMELKESIELYKTQVQGKSEDSKPEGRLRKRLMSIISKMQGKGEDSKQANATTQQNRPEFLRGFDPGLTVQDLAFNFGPGPGRRGNARQALAWGMLLLIPLLLLHGWSLFSSEFNGFLPYPLLDIGVRLGVFVSQYLAMAFFLGYFFPEIRGRNGLQKGVVVAGFAIISLLPVHLMLADSSADLLALLVWAGTVLAYNVLIGVIAFDLQTLSNHNYGPGRLGDVYDTGQALASITGSGTPFVAAIYSAAVGGLDQLVPAVAKVMFPALTFTTAHSELLKVLLDLAKRLAGA